MTERTAPAVKPDEREVRQAVERVQELFCVAPWLLDSQGSPPISGCLHVTYNDLDVLAAAAMLANDNPVKP